MNGDRNTSSNKQPPVVARGSTPKKFKLVMGLFIVFVLAISALVIARAYEKWRGMENVEKLAKALRQYEREIIEARMADTYGGKTPQETLQLYIDAVERGDYELASKYFVEEKREAELKSLKNAARENIVSVINVLKGMVLSEGSFSPDKKEYVISRPLLADFVLYPNGVWKISEI